MVNTGFPSRDCNTCRRRRVKCDLRRPGCLRCEKIGQQCSGYRDLSRPEHRFCVVTPSSYRDSRKRDPLPAKRGQQETKNGRLLKASDFRNPTLSQGLTEKWDVHIMPLIVSQFSLPGSSRMYSTFECFPGLLRAAEPGSPLYLTCHVVVSSYLANKTHSQTLAVAHQDLYGKALRALHLALLNKNQLREDAILLTVWLLCLRELIVGTPDTEQQRRTPLDWGIHSRALLGILNARPLQVFASPTGSQLFQLAYQQIQIEAFQAGRSPPAESLDWFTAVHCSEQIESLVLIPSLLHGDEAVRICSAIRSLIKESSVEKMLSGLIDQVQACRQLEDAMQYHERHHVIFSSQPDTVMVKSFIVGLYTRNYQDACLFCVYREILKFLCHVFEVHSPVPTLSEDIAGIRLTGIQRSHAIARRILDTLPVLLPTRSQHRAGEPPFCPLNWADALKVLWPVRLIASSPNVPVGYRIEADSVLSKIGHEIGLMQAVGAYHTSPTAAEGV